MSITPDNSPKQAGSPDRQHTDIDLSGWWRHLPSGCHPYILVARLDRPIGWWLLLLPGWWVIPVAAPGIGAGFFLMALFLAGAVAMRAAGCVVNDLWDRRLDSQVERTAGRPLAAGTIGIFEALLFLGLLCAIGLTVLVQLPFFAILTGIAALPLVILYPLAKRVTWWPQAVLGLTFSWGVPLGWAAASGSPPPAALALVYAGSVAWVFGYDTIYAIQDMADDREVGVKSSALGLGRHLRAGVATAYALAVAGLGLGFWLLLGTGIWVAALVAMALHLAWQSYRLDAGDPAMALRLFKSNRDAGLILTAGLVINQIAA
ncbi:MAG: 4-hydroxybenzoate octaprenyltransferase [Pseudomonadota bacterium]|nr:4-hydroxybenzoate octaprenyltransferase [Pseudomonadota bacterium]MEC8245658.1 4-hydroxybenzoate octaprenyltransferase [Pseudomonadota bacterium]MEC8516155.1 4-hydroxybenzoate octaprenyltransferase [Pseudomonadota bacterium]MEC8548895.1 4-hydroxybenzoate octaprenyltransferase [Pseudomonadota bacterium]MEC8711874.1 4-hydroxybenzoate octaprenyltransferase [Pseudomonadota bacterium]